MATADEILAAMNTDEKTLVIDGDLRTISIPSAIKNIGVESDEEVLVLNFRMPGTYCGINLSTFNIRINYLNANAEGDVYDVDDAELQSDGTISFTWLVGRHATSHKGNVRFNVCLKECDENSIVLKEFNTTIATLPVLEGLETSEQVIVQYADILEQWKQKLFGIGDTEEARIRAASETQLTAISDKGNEVLESIESKGAETLDNIPDDYTELYGMAKDAIRTRANAIVQNVEGEIVTASDCSTDYLRGLRVFGKSIQVATSGKNLLQVTAKSTLNNGGSIIINDDCTISLIGTFTQNTAIAIGKCNAIGELILSAGVTSSDINDSYLYVSLGDGTNVGWYGIDKTFSNDGSECSAYLVIIAGTYRNATIKPMIRLSSIADSTYEPYSGGVSSPSPDWTQDVVGTDNSEIVVQGKNLLNPVGPTTTMKGVTLTNNGDGSFTVIGTSSGAVGLPLTDLNRYPLKLHKGVTYTQSFEVLSGTKPEKAVIVPAVKDSVGNTLFNYFTDNQTKTSATDYTLYSYTLYMEADVTANFTFRVQLEIGSEATAWEPYRSEQSITFSNPTVLHGVPVASNGNYTDSNGQQWLCDEVDFERGVYIQRIGSITFDGSEGNWSINTYNYNQLGVYIFGHNIPDIVQEVYDNPIMCDKFQTQLWGYLTANNRNKIYSTPNYIQIFLEDQSITDATMFETWLVSNPVTVYYPLKSYVETPLTDEEIFNFSQLRSNYPNTTILNDSKAHMNVKYNADTQLYFNEHSNDPSDEQVEKYVNAWLETRFTNAEEVSF